MIGGKKSARDEVQLDTALDLIANELLTLIEGREVRTLGWGFTDVRHDLDNELEGLVQELPASASRSWAELRHRSIESTALLDNLIERKLVFASGGFYRTRFAETIRLLALLRQRFSDEDWNTAPTLVADYRLAVSRRRYPTRDVSVETIRDDLSKLHLDPQVISAVNALLADGDGGHIELAEFQREAIARILRSLKSKNERGVVIGAGTGSGKTKAFYIPALAQIAFTLSGTRHVQVLAIYPRNELLKDQFVEAFIEARKLDAVLSELHKRPIVIGAYYGDTPYTASYLDTSLGAASSRTRTFWEYDGRLEGWLCPFLRCPNAGCGREALLWARSDVQAEIKANESKNYGQYEILRCPDCGFETPLGTVQLTRASMERQPPDILFTSTESLNRSLANTSTHALFGINVAQPPRLILLDEIHTYAGVTGAQVAYLLRRWRFGRTKLRDPGCCIVGLSATLMQAESFFAKLTGLPEHVIEYITPESGQFIEEGAEYNVVVKGDPASGTSLLSTSVQTTMLLGRVLDPMLGSGTPSLSHNAIGQRMFAFTDSLDVINRWYHIADDAETHQRLSQFRRIDKTWSPDIRRQRNDAGQVWWMGEELKHDLTQPLVIERTSSQDRGVDRAAQLVIATSTLEVGFNDPTVGAVIQHKAPRNLASFLQRKGRAGRLRAMRPWTVVVTSAYGRDRWAFQHAEQLFNPILQPNHLPIDNDYVRKIQASFALMDWISLQPTGKNGRANVWELLTNHRDRDAKSRQYLASSRAAIVVLLKRVLDGELADSLTSHLANALKLDPNSVAMRGILWNDPRSLMFDLIPTLIRQLETNWNLVGEGEWRDTPSTHPIPYFVPSALFSDLNLPQLEITVPYPPRRGKQLSPSIELMSLSAGMREFAPGHARKRFTERDRPDVSHWLPVHSPQSQDKTVFELHGSGVVTSKAPIAVLPCEGGQISVYKPLRYQLEVLPNSVEANSTGRLRWELSFEIHDEFSLAGRGESAPSIPLRPASPLRTFISAINYFVHEEGCWARVVRYAPAVDMTFKARFRKALPKSARFEHEGQAAAIGFAIEADALRFQFEPLNVNALRAQATWPRLYQRLGAKFFRDLLLRDPRLAEAEVSVWDIDWLWQIELAAISATAVVLDISLEEASEHVDRNRLSIVQRTLKTIFQPQRDEAGEETEEYGRRYEELLLLEEKVDVIRALQEHRAVLWDESHPGLNDWVAERHRASLAAALMTTITRFVPDIDPDDLLFDVCDSEVWISEATPGGVGIVSQIVAEIHDKPRQFDLAFVDTVQNCEREQLSTQLRRISQLLQEPGNAISKLFQSVRQGGDLGTIEQLTQALTDALEAEGIVTNRALFVAMNSKFLRPNSGQDSDELVARLVSLWDQEAARLQTEIDLRTISVAAARLDETSDALDRLLSRVGTRGATENQKFNLLQSLLWEGCVDSCPACIQVGNLYADAGYVYRSLLAAQLESSFSQVTFGASNWKNLIRDHLVKHLEVRLTCSQDQLAACTSAVLEFIVEPIDLVYQLAYCAIDRVTWNGTTWILHLVIPDLLEI